MGSLIALALSSRVGGRRSQNHAPAGDEVRAHLVHIRDTLASQADKADKKGRCRYARHKKGDPANHRIPHSLGRWPIQTA